CNALKADNPSTGHAPSRASGKATVGCTGSHEPLRVDKADKVIINSLETARCILYRVLLIGHDGSRKNLAPTGQLTRTKGSCPLAHSGTGRGRHGRPQIGRTSPKGRPAWQVRHHQDDAA